MSLNNNLSRTNLYKSLKEEIQDSFIQDYIDGAYTPIYNHIVSVVDSNLDSLDDFDIISDLDDTEIRDVLIYNLSKNLDEDKILSKINSDELY